MTNAIKLINEALNHDTPSQVPWRARLETALFEIERLQVAIGWALGERADADGHWFGELSEDERRKPYWWRTHLRKIAGMETFVYDKESRTIVRAGGEGVNGGGK